MSYDVGLDASNDLPLVTAHITGRDLVIQRVRIRLETFLGEWFLDISKGLDFLGWLDQKPPRTQEIGASIRREIETTPGVRRVDQWLATFDASNERLTFSGEVYTVDEDDPVAFHLVPASERGNRYPFVIFWGASGGIG